MLIRDRAAGFGSNAVSTCRPLLMIGASIRISVIALGQRSTLTGEHAIDQRPVGSSQEIGTHRRFRPASIRTVCGPADFFPRTFWAESSMRVPGPKIALAPAAYYAS